MKTGFVNCNFFIFGLISTFIQNSDMSDWAKQMISEIDEKLEGVKVRDQRFFRTDEFKRNIERIADFSEKCPVCSAEKLNIEEVLKTFEQAIKVPGRARREYDRLIGRLSGHLQKEHGFFPPFYFTYLFSFFGMLAGLLIGYFLMKIFPGWDYAMLTAGFVVGLISGYFSGNKRDNRVRLEKKLM